MSRYSVYLVSLLLICIAALGQADKPVTIPVPTSTHAPSPKPTTQPPTEAPTEPPTTTKPTTTTTSTTTPPPPPPPPKPTPTPPKPTPPPKPLPPPEQGTWNYTDAKSNVTCVLVQFAARLNVTYLMNEGNNSTKLASALLNVPSNAAVVGGNCGNVTQWIQLSWPNANAPWANNVTLQFSRNDTSHLYTLAYFNATLTPDDHCFPNSSSTSPLQLSHASPEWAAPLAASYRCLAPTQLNMTEASGAVATLDLTKLQEQAFRTQYGPGFSSARDCGGGDVPDAVPVAVGCALGGLVLVVLAAYLVGRRRSAASGYLSM